MITPRAKWYRRPVLLAGILIVLGLVAVGSWIRSITNSAALDRALHHPDPAIRREAIESLRKDLVRAVPHLAGALCDPDQGVRSAAAASLARLPGAWRLEDKLTPQRAVDLAASLPSSLGDPDPLVREAAARALGELAEHGNPATLFRLEQRLADDVPQVRGRVIYAIDRFLTYGQAGNSSPTLVAALIHRLQDSESKVRVFAAVALGRIGGGARAATRPLADSLADAHPSVRCEVAVALGSIQPDDAYVVTTLIARLDQEAEPFVWDAVADAVGRAGAPAHEAVPILIRNLGHSNYSRRELAAKVLGKLGPEASSSAIPHLLRLMEDKDPRVRSAAAESLRLIRPMTDD